MTASIVKHVGGCGAVIFSFALALAAGAAPADENLLEKVDAVRALGENFTFTAEITDARGKRLKMSIRVKDRVKSLVRYTEPARNAGRALLFVERNMWIYVPGTRRALRIAPQQQVIGGVASADIARTVYALDYALDSVAEQADENGESRRLLSLSRKSKGAAYARIELLVGGDEARPLSAVFYASSGNRSLKTAYFEGYREVLGSRRPTSLRVVDHLRGDREILLEYSDFVLEDTPDAWFQPAYLKRLK